MARVSTTTRIVAALALVAVLAGCRGRGADEHGGVAPHFSPGFNLFSPEQDVEIGRSSAEEVRRQIPLLDDGSPVVAYVRDLGSRLAAVAPGEKYPYEFHVADVGEINAFALPGGIVFVNRGTIEAAADEGELAGVLAHEISHVALRHGTSQASKAYIAQKGLGILQRILGGGEQGEVHVGDVVAAIGGLGLNTLFLRFGRTAETQADVTGAQMMAAVGYDPIHMARFFETIAREYPDRPPAFLTDHPDPGDRARQIEEVRRSIQIRADATHDETAFRRVKAQLRALPAPRAARAPLVGPTSGPNGGVRPEPPAAADQTFQAPTATYEVAFPENWDALSDRAETAVLAPRGGYGKLNDSFVVTHGVLAGVVAGGELEAATNAFVAVQLEANQDFRVAGASRRVELGGRPALATPLEGPSPVTGRLEVDVVYTTILADGRMFYAITVAPQDETGIYAAAFERVIGSVRFRN
jgi:hypothetical protein